jgi:hypothetical protein
MRQVTEGGEMTVGEDLYEHVYDFVSVRFQKGYDGL